LETLINHEWPGNVRQLKNVVERLVIIADDLILDRKNLSDHWGINPNHISDTVPKTLKELKSVKRHLLENQFGRIEKNFLQKALSAAKGNIAQAARQVGMQRSNFSVLMKKHGLSANRIDTASKEESCLN
jgi:two-component system NtrC family response regulator